MSERRYVVELTKPVPASKLPSASEQIARRLGLEVSRVVTLLKDRVGPVTKPVLPSKADAIAAVFQEAGVDVAVYDAAAYQTDWGAPKVVTSAGQAAEGPSREPAGEVPATRPAPPERPAPAPEPPREAPVPRATAAELPHEPERAAFAGDDGPSAEDHAYGPVTTLPDLDRWDEGDPWRDPWREARLHATADDLDEVTEVEAEGDPPPPGARSAARRAADGGEELPVAVRQTLEDLPLPPAERSPTVRPGVWVPEQDRRPLRAVLLVALGVAVVLFVALQFVYGARPRAGASYEDGLAAYQVGDFAAARRAWERAAASGSPRAEYMLGYLAQNGLGRPWSYREAAERYAVAAEAGLPEARLALGELYLEGLGVAEDPETGAAWVERAASAGHVPALYRLGELRFHGIGVPQDFEGALEAFAAAAALGSTRAADFVALADHLRGSNVSDR